MTPPVGLPSGMDPFTLDGGTCERLVTGAVEAPDAPPEYRSVARTLHALRAAPDRSEWGGESAAVKWITAAVVVRPRPRSTPTARRARRLPSRATRLAMAVVVAGAVCATGGLASAGSLPEPAQHAASAVLGTVGISVPSGDEKPADVEQPPPPTADVPPPPAATDPAPPGAGAPAAEMGVPATGAESQKPATNTPPSGSSKPAAPGQGETKVQGNPSPGNPSPGTPRGNAYGYDNGHSPSGPPPVPPGQVEKAP